MLVSEPSPRCSPCLLKLLTVLARIPATSQSHSPHPVIRPSRSRASCGNAVRDTSS